MADAVPDKLLDAAQTSIRALSLAGVPSAQVYVRELLSDRDLVLPAVVLAPWEPEKRVDPDAFGGEKSWEYSFVVAFLAAGNQTLALDRAGHLRREQVLDLLDDPADPTVVYAGVTNVWRSLVEPRVVVDTSLFRDANLLAGVLGVRVAVAR